MKLEMYDGYMGYTLHPECVILEPATVRIAFPIDHSQIRADFATLQTLIGRKYGKMWIKADLESGLGTAAQLLVCEENGCRG